MNVTAILHLFGRSVSVTIGALCLFGMVMKADASVQSSYPPTGMVNIHFDGVSRPAGEQIDAKGYLSSYGITFGIPTFRFDTNISFVAFNPT